MFGGISSSLIKIGCTVNWTAVMPCTPVHYALLADEKFIVQFNPIPISATSLNFFRGIHGLKLNWPLDWSKWMKCNDLSLCNYLYFSQVFWPALVMHLLLAEHLAHFSSLSSLFSFSTRVYLNPCYNVRSTFFNFLDYVLS